MLVKDITHPMIEKASETPKSSGFDLFSESEQRCKCACAKISNESDEKTPYKSSKGKPYCLKTR